MLKFAAAVGILVEYVIVYELVYLTNQKLRIFKIKWTKKFSHKITGVGSSPEVNK